MQIEPYTTFVIKATEKEFALITRILGFVAGIEGPNVGPADKEAAAELNLRLLEQQAAVYYDKLQQTKGKIELASAKEKP